MKSALKKILPRFVISSVKNYRKRRQLRAFAGTEVYCALCDSSFREFLPYGVSKRQNARCLNCGSLERHRLQLKYLQEKTDLFTRISSRRMLHFAPEKPFRRIFSALQGLEYVPCDLHPKRYEDEKVEVVKVDISDIPFPDDHFDVILCNHVLEHIPDDAHAMKELYRVMKKGGFGIFQVPIDYNRSTTYEDFSIVDPVARVKAFGQRDHVRWYGRDYVERLRRAGFQVKEDDFVKTLPASDISRLGLQPSELIYYCQKV